MRAANNNALVLFVVGFPSAHNMTSSLSATAWEREVKGTDRPSTPEACSKIPSAWGRRFEAPGTACGVG